RRDFFPRMSAFTRIMSITGIPSVMQTTNSTSASTASRIESAAAAAGTNTIDALHPVFWRASQTVSNTGTLPSNICPPLPGVTPATTFVPYSMQCRVWNAPALPVIPCTTSRVFLPTKTDIQIRKVGREGKSWKSEIEQYQSTFLLACLRHSRFLVSWFPDSFLFCLVSHQFVSVGVAELRHPTNWRLGLLKFEADSTFF